MSRGVNPKRVGMTSSGADVVEAELAQLVRRDRERQVDASDAPATSRMSGTGIGRMTRRLSRAASTSSVISRYVQ